MKKQFFLSLGLLFMALAFVPKAPVDTYKINAQQTKLGWVGKKVTGQHNGTFAVKEGSLEVKGGKITGGSFVLDMTKIVCEDLTDKETNGKFIGHLNSPDFFDVAKHPTGSFAIKKATATGKNGKTEKYKIDGELTLKGITKPVSIEADVTMAGKKVTAVSAFKINRTQWDMKFRSGSFFENLGDKMIYDDVELSLNAVFEK
jgi:polyisoprenoid-binding protein YceI